HTNSRDEALALPTEGAARIALRTQQIIGFESGVANTIDPFAGSYQIEKMTSEIEDGARELLTRIEAAGGTLAAIEAGYIQRQVQDSAYKAQLAVDSGEAVVVGVNRYITATEGSESTEKTSIEVFQIDPDLEAQQVRRVQQVRQARDQARWRASLDAVRGAASGTENLVPPIITAVEAHATVGEIADTLRGVFGEYREVSLD
ncbi:MAG: methylmalonyl-CoA mutase family protein, partial [Vicinamibacterales bacterium]